MVIKWKMEYDTNQCGTALEDLTFMVLIQHGHYCRIEFSVSAETFMSRTCVVLPSVATSTLTYYFMQSSGVDIVALKQKL